MTTRQPNILLTSFAERADRWGNARKLIWIFVATSAVLIFLAIYPRAVYIRLFPWDLFGFFDGIHRIVSGEVPNRDFSTPLGPLLYVLPALFVRFGANPLLSLAYAQGALLAFNLIVIVHLFKTRLGGIAGLLFALWTSLLLAARMDLGFPMQLVTFAMNYNRYCSVFLCEILIFFIPPQTENRGAQILDVLIIALLTLVLFYTKMTYFAVAAVALGLLALASHAHAGRVGAALAVFLAVVAGIELGCRLLPGYFAALFAAAHTSGAIRGTVRGMLNSIQLNLPELAACFLLPLVVLYVVRVVRGRDVVLFAFVAAASLLLLNQNAQVVVLAVPFTLLFLALDIADRRAEPGTSRDAAVGVLLAAIVVMFSWYCYPLMLNVAVSFVKSTSDVKSTSEIRPVGAETITRRLLTDWHPSDESLLPDLVKNDIPPFDIFARSRGSSTNFPGMRLSMAEYAISLEDGAKAVRSYCGGEPHILTADQINPFPALLDLPPAGRFVLFIANRTIPAENPPSAQQVFAGVTCLMVPRLPIDYTDRGLLLATYAGYLKENFRIAGSSDYWIVYRRVGGAAWQ